MVEREHPQHSTAPLLKAGFGAQDAQLLCVAAKLGLADQLGEGPRTGADLAHTLGVDAWALQRVLRGLVRLGVCNDDGHRFGLTPLGEHLRSDHPDSVQARVILNAEVHQALWADLLATVRTGRSASDRVFGMPFYQYLSQNPAAGALFDRAMTSAGWIRYRFHPAIEAYDFGRFGTIVDVGGGNAALMIELLKRYPQPTGTVFDVPRLAEVAKKNIEAAGLTGRCHFLGGNAFEAVPAGGDAYILSNFLINWGDEEAVVPLRNCRKAIGPGGKLFLVEWMLPMAGEPREEFRFWDTVTMDLIMLAAFGSRSGYVRTRLEFQALLKAAGFDLQTVIPTHATVCVIEATPT